MKNKNGITLAVVFALIISVSTVIMLVLTGKIGSSKDFLKPRMKKENNTETVVENIVDETLPGEDEVIFVPTEFGITNYAGTQISVDKSPINLKGTSDPTRPLLCNAKRVETASTGEFSIDCPLKPGLNEIIFRHKDETYTYTVNFNMKLITEVSPENEVTVPAGMDVEISCTAIKGASVSLSLGGKTYKMEPESDTRIDDDTDISSVGFTVYSTSVNAPDSVSSEKNIGKVKITAEYKGSTETAEGGSINVTPKNYIPKPVVIAAYAPETVQSTTKLPKTKPATTLPASTAGKSETEKPEKSKAGNLSHKFRKETTAVTAATPVPNGDTPVDTGESSNGQGTLTPSDGLQKFSPFKDYGLGKAEICQIIDDYVETFPGGNTATYSLPNYTPLPKGTVDYVVSTAEFDDEKYCILASGYKVPFTRTERLASGNMGRVTHITLKDGYITPANNIKVISCETSNGESKIILDMNKNVPFTAALTGQSYKDYNGRAVAVSSCMCTGIQFIFSETASASGNISFGNSTVLDGSWSTDTGKCETKLTLRFANPGRFYGFHCEYDDGHLILSFKNKPSGLSGYTIMLDPGHGGIDSGAPCSVSAAGMSYEKNINLSIASKVKALLEKEGATVLMTRSDDKWVCYTDRNDAVRTRRPDMFIAIHCDASEAASAYGTTAYYYRAYSQPLAKAVHDSIVTTYKSSVYPNESNSFKSGIDRGTNFYAFRVTRVEECPAILLEYGFVTNTKECQKLQTSSVRDSLAQATVNGIKKYVSSV